MLPDKSGLVLVQTFPFNSVGHVGAVAANVSSLIKAGLE